MNEAVTHSKFVLTLPQPCRVPQIQNEDRSRAADAFTTAFQRTLFETDGKAHSVDGQSCHNITPRCEPQAQRRYRFP